MNATTSAAVHAPELNQSDERRVVFASTLGTIFEWYDFYIYGSLAVFLSSVFFPPGNPTVALMSSLAALAAGFVVRPFGAIVFGQIGDLIGRKYTFLVTLLMMGVATAVVGLLPSYETIGNAAWIILLVLRLVQGLAVGGEYGGAVIYVAEHTESKRRGFLTSWIQTAATMGLVLSIAVILGTQALMSPEAFKSWGWRVPFLLSIVMLVFSLYVRAKLHESPVFARMKAEGRASKRPIRDTFGQWSNLKFVLLALFGVTAGMGATWYTGQFYVLLFMQQVAKIDLQTAYLLMAAGLTIGAPSFILTSWLSDRVGRKWIMMAGLLLAAILYRPMFTQLLEAANPQLVATTQKVPVLVHADQKSEACAFALSASLIGTHPDHLKPCVQAKKFLVASGINFSFAPAVAGQPVAMSVAGKQTPGFDAAVYRTELTAAGYPAKAEPAGIAKGRIILIIALMTLLVSMVYGPVAAYLVELFPPQTRNTSLSFPYHIGAGVIGGFLPFFATYFSIAVGDIFAGLWYPVVITFVTCIIGSLLLPETLGRSREEIQGTAGQAGATAARAGAR
jgi:MFS family permease